MRERFQRMPHIEQFAAWGMEIEGYLSSLVLRQGVHYEPSEDTDVALVVDARMARPSDGMADVVVPGAKDNDEYGARVDCRMYAKRDLLVFELDWVACRSLMAQSRRFRDMFLKATTTRLSSLYRMRGTSGRTRRQQWPIQMSCSAFCRILLCIEKLKRR